MMKKLNSKYLRVKCKKCSKEQVVFSNPASVIKCNSCNEVLAKPKGGKAEINAQVLEML